MNKTTKNPWSKRWNKKPPKNPLVISCSLTLSREMELKYRKWQKQQDKKAATKQNQEYSYYGSIGGGYEFIFCPTGIGTILIVRNTLTEEEIDLTDYENW